MSSYTNCPNPERPGVPMFPERGGWHLVAISGMPVALYWKPVRERYEWRDTVGIMYSRQELGISAGTHYIGPVLTPTQIAEMLAGERCAKECDEKVAFANHELSASGSHEETRYWMGEHCAATFCADAIRALGDEA